MENNVIVRIENLYVNFNTERGMAKVLDGISFDIKDGQKIALIGETGCGKSVAAKSIMRLLPKNTQIQGKILFKNRNLLELPEREMRRIRGREIGMIFQDPLSSLNPVFTTGNQIAEMFKAHRLKITTSIREAMVELLKIVHMPDAEKRVDSYPFELSGGMRQRIMTAMMLSAHPSLLIADEPTTALDVTIQAQILKLLLELNETMNTTIFIITHDPGVVAELVDRVIVMYSGQIIETASVYAIFENPLHPYTRGLMRAMPLGHKQERSLEHIPGRVPDLINPPNGCRFNPRCPYAINTCMQKKPKLVEKSKGHFVACFLSEGMKNGQG